MANWPLQMDKLLKAPFMRIKLRESATIARWTEQLFMAFGIKIDSNVNFDCIINHYDAKWNWVTKGKRSQEWNNENIISK